MERIPENGAMNLPAEVAAYDRLSRDHLPFVEDRFVRRCLKFLRRLHLPAGAHVVDVGTGPARIPIRCLCWDPTLRIIGVDLSWAMLRRAAANVRAAGVDHRVRLVRADARHLPLRSDAFDMSLTHSTLHHLPDPVAAMAEMVRVTAPGRPLVIRDLRRPPRVFLWLYLRIFGHGYDGDMKRMYRESLQAGFSVREMRRMGTALQQTAIRVRRFFITHVGLEGYREQEPYDAPRTASRTMSGKERHPSGNGAAW